MKVIKLTRESVAAGDDINAPHFKEIQIEEDWKIEQILNKVLNSKYLPRILGGSTWSVAINKPIAVISSNYPDFRIKIIAGAGSDFPHQGTKGFVDIRTIHFNYHAQQGSDIVLKVLERFNLNQ
ncbi:hypothetical protein [uncultured Croceitalea sp.]|uniref:hypothetical protein n=1 Tax=uncultured Croceitalea sp. TaxID=1798908 RepID=UPI00330626B1